MRVLVRRSAQRWVAVLLLAAACGVRTPARVDIAAMIAKRGAVEARRDLTIRVLAEPRDVQARLALAELDERVGRPAEAIEQLEAVLRLGGPLGTRWRDEDRARLGRLLLARGRVRLARGAASALVDLQRAQSFGAAPAAAELDDARIAIAIAQLRHTDAKERAQGRATLATFTKREPAWRGAAPTASVVERGAFGAWLWTIGARREAYDQLAAWHGATKPPRDETLQSAYLRALAWWSPMWLGETKPPPAQDLVGPERCQFPGADCEPPVVEEPPLPPAAALDADPRAAIAVRYAIARVHAGPPAPPAPHAAPPTAGAPHAAASTAVAPTAAASTAGARTAPAPSAGAPTAGAPTAGARTAPAPSAGAPTAGAPTAGAPTAAAPTVAAPNAAAPTAAAPTAAAPKGGAPTAAAPTAGAPTAAAPTAAAPSAAAPTAAAPNAAAPTAAAPSAAAPSAAPNAAAPTAAAPTAGAPTAGAPSAAAPKTAAQQSAADVRGLIEIATAFARDPVIAERLGRDFVASAADAAVAHATLGALFDALGDPGRARAAWHAAVDSSAEPAFVRGLAEAMARGGDGSAALVFATQAAAAWGDPAVVWVAVARGLEGAGQHVDALTAARYALDLAGPQVLPQALDIAIATSRALGRTAQADALFVQRAQLAPRANSVEAEAQAALVAHREQPTASTIARLWVASRTRARDVELRSALLGALEPDDPRRATVTEELVTLAADPNPERALAAVAALRRHR